MAAALTLAAVCAVAGCTTTGGADAPPDTVAPTTAEVAGAALETLLLEDSDVARITAAPTLRTVEAYARIPDPDGRTYSDALCGGAISSASTTTYPGGNVTGVRGHRLNNADPDTGGARTRSVDQAVIAFPTASAARDHVAAARGVWAACAGTTVETRDPAARTLWRVGTPRDTGEVLSVTSTHRSGWATEHAITAAGAVVIDVSVSSADAGADRATTIVRSIADRIAQ